MQTNELFGMALGLTGGWKVVDSDFAEDGGLSLCLDFERGARFACPECGVSCPVHDTVEREWRHLDFWQHRTRLKARVPRVKCPEHGVRLAEVPWAVPGSGFTLMMEAFIMLLCQRMPVAEAAAILGEHDTRLWRVVCRHVEAAQAGRDWSGVTRLLVDEPERSGDSLLRRSSPQGGAKRRQTSAKKGHRYVTCFVDADTGELLCMTRGKGAETFAEFAREMAAHGADPAQIALVCMDMSKAFRKGAKTTFPKARVVFDRFHVMQMAGRALDVVRKLLQREGADLKGSLWAIRGNPWTRSDEQLETRRRLLAAYPKLARAMALKDTLQDILESEDAPLLRWWCAWAQRSRLKPFVALARSVREHWEGITAFMETRVSNGRMEAINGLIQLAKRLARGFRNFTNFRAMAYLKAGRLTLDLPSLKTHSI